jgi:hypothetical protein
MVYPEGSREKSIAWIRSIVTLSMLCAYLFGNSQAVANNESIQFAEKVNLALRRTAHHLLTANGDSVSVIPAVQQLDANTFSIRIDHLFDYDKLPQLLQQSLDMQKIRRTYNVTILNCETGQLQLGYNFADLNQKGGVACAGRKQKPGCYNIKVIFEPSAQLASQSFSWWMLPFGSVMAVLGFIVWRRTRKEVVRDDEIPAVAEIVDQKLHFGDSGLDVSNLLLISAGNRYSLTYREAKLLNLFVTNLNQILERDFILKSVWEDEGITVGRSPDVFVSRLRKMLAGDVHVKIAAVHGVGYRMEVIP